MQITGTNRGAGCPRPVRIRLRTQPRSPVSASSLGAHAATALGSITPSAIQDATAARQRMPARCAPPKRGISVVIGCVSRPLNLSSVKDADRQPLVTTGCGGGYLPIGYLPTGYLPTGAGAGGGGSLRGRSAAAAALSIAKDAAAAVRIFSMMYRTPLKVCNNLVRADSARSNGKMPEQRQSHNEKGDLLICFPDICCIKSTSLKGSERGSRRHDATRRQLFPSAARERSRRTKEVRPPQRAEMQASTTDVLRWPS